MQVRLVQQKTCGFVGGSRYKQLNEYIYVEGERRVRVFLMYIDISSDCILGFPAACIGGNPQSLLQSTALQTILQFTSTASLIHLYCTKSLPFIICLPVVWIPWIWGWNAGLHILASVPAATLWWYPMCLPCKIQLSWAHCQKKFARISHLPWYVLPPPATSLQGPTACGN